MLLTHAKYSAQANLCVPCCVYHLTFGGRCLNCGWEPYPDQWDMKQLGKGPLTNTDDIPTVEVKP